MDINTYYKETLDGLQREGNLRRLPEAQHCGKWIGKGESRLLNLSSNDYLGLASDRLLRNSFMAELDEDEFLFSSSSSRLLTGNFSVYTALEELMAERFRAESALVFSSGYHMNTGILPAVADSRTLVLADKLVHASIIDGIRLSAARCIRYRHQDYRQLEALLSKNHADYERVIIVTESIFSMDGDVTPLPLLVEMKKRYANVMLYVDEAHGIGVRGEHGLGVAEEQGCIRDIDFLCGTFGKTMASVGAYVVCRKVLRDFLVNRMRTLIFTTALPPVCVAWTKFVFERLDCWQEKRKHLAVISGRLQEAFRSRGYNCPSESHIVPLTVGESGNAVLKAEEFQRKGFYVLPVRPPTVPEGTSRLRFSLTASVTDEELDRLLQVLD